ncbi:MAG: hypothetical protein AAF411_09350 [Myxococcota bacterium]
MRHAYFASLAFLVLHACGAGAPEPSAAESEQVPAVEEPTPTPTAEASGAPEGESQHGGAASSPSRADGPRPPLPTRTWWESVECEAAPAHVASHGGGRASVVFGPSGGLAVWDTSPTDVRVAALSTAGDLSETVHELSVPPIDRAPWSIGYVGGGFGLVLSTECGRDLCLVGYGLRLDGAPVGNPTRRPVGRPWFGAFASVTPDRPTSGRLWLTRERENGGRDSWTEVLSLRVDGEEVSFETPDRSLAAARSDAPHDSSLQLAMLADVGESFDALRGVDEDGERRRLLALGLNHSVIRGLGNRVRAFVSSKGRAHFLVQSRDALEHVVASFEGSRTAAVVSREPASADSLPPVFRERVSMRVEEGELAFVDVLGNPVGARLAVPEGRVHYAGGDLVVTSSGDGTLRVTPIRCSAGASGHAPE